MLLGANWIVGVRDTGRSVQEPQSHEGNRMERESMVHSVMHGRYSSPSTASGAECPQ